MKVSVFGSTGSIGTSTLDVIAYANAQSDVGIEVDTLVAGRNLDLLVEQAKTFRPAHVVLQDESRIEDLRSALAGTGVSIAAGSDAAIEAAARPVDKLVAAISGTDGVVSTVTAIDAGVDVLLANKEAMVCAGPIILEKAERSGANIIPVDSEHNAIFQCLDQSSGLERIILTASGGPFLSAPLEDMRLATPEKALAHPNWSMGAKNSLDSATMMNKGLELIEAVYLFGVPQSKIDVVIHPQSIIHSLVSYKDGSVIAQMGSPDMRTPIAYALSCPDRIETAVERLDLVALSRLDFSEPDHQRFPALNLARLAADAGTLGTSVFNAANEAAGSGFLSKKCGFLDISTIVERCLSKALDTAKSQMPHRITTVDDVLYVTDRVRGWVRDELAEQTGKILHVVDR